MVLSGPKLHLFFMINPFTAAPARWLLAERLARARELLETTPAGVEQIAQAVGFGAPALRHHFRKSLATTPHAYRARFGASPATPSPP